MHPDALADRPRTLLLRRVLASERPRSEIAARSGRRFEAGAGMLSIRAVDLVFLAACLAAFVVRFRALTAVSGAVGVDHGNFLSIGHRLVGQGVEGGGSTYPPLVPLLVVAAQWLGDVSVTLAVLSAAAGVLPALGVHLGFRHLPNRIPVSAAAALLLMAGSVSEPVAWGGTPQLIGLGALPPALVGLARIARRDEAASVWLTSGSILILFAASHLVGLLLLVAAVPVLLPLLWTAADRANTLKRLARTVAPSIVLVPVYLVLVRDLSVADPAGAAAMGAPVTLQDRLVYVFNDNPRLWLIILCGAGLSLILGIGAFRQPEYQAVLSMAVVAALLNLSSAERRYAYFVPSAIVMAMAAAVGSTPLPRRAWMHVAVSGPLLALAVSGWLAGIKHLPAQVAFYATHAPRDSGLDALDWLRASTPRDSLVAVPSVIGSPVGWWVEGYGERRALVEADPSLLNFVDERRRSLAAASIFRPNLVSDASIAQAQRLGVDYLVIFRRSDGFDAQQLQSYVETHPWSVAFESPDVVILTVPSP